MIKGKMVGFVLIFLVLLTPVFADDLPENFNDNPSVGSITSDNIGQVDFTRINPDKDVSEILEKYADKLSDDQLKQITAKQLSDPKTLSQVPNLKKLNPDNLAKAMNKQYGIVDFKVEEGVDSVTISKDGVVINKIGDNEYTLDLTDFKGKDASVSVVKKAFGDNPGFIIKTPGSVTEITSPESLTATKNVDGTISVTDKSGKEVLKVDPKKSGNVNINGNKITLSDGAVVVPSGAHGVGFSAKGSVIIDVFSKDGNFRYDVSGPVVLDGDYHGKPLKGIIHEGKFSWTVPANQNNVGEMAFDVTRGDVSYLGHKHSGNFKATYDGYNLEQSVLRSKSSYVYHDKYGKFSATDGLPYEINFLKQWSGEGLTFDTALSKRKEIQKRLNELSPGTDEYNKLLDEMKSQAGTLKDKTNVAYINDNHKVLVGKISHVDIDGNEYLGKDDSALLHFSTIGGEDWIIDSFESSPGEISVLKRIAKSKEGIKFDGNGKLYKKDTDGQYKLYNPSDKTLGAVINDPATLRDMSIDFKFSKKDGVMESLLGTDTIRKLGAYNDATGKKYPEATFEGVDFRITPVSEGKGMNSLQFNQDAFKAIEMSATRVGADGNQIGNAVGISAESIKERVDEFSMLRKKSGAVLSRAAQLGLIKGPVKSEGPIYVKEQLDALIEKVSANGNKERLAVFNDFVNADSLSLEGDKAGALDIYQKYEADTKLGSLARDSIISTKLSQAKDLDPKSKVTAYGDLVKKIRAWSTEYPDDRSLKLKLAQTHEQAGDKNLAEFQYRLLQDGKYQADAAMGFARMTDDKAKAIEILKKSYEATKDIRLINSISDIHGKLNTISSVSDVDKAYENLLKEFNLKDSADLSRAYKSQLLLQSSSKLTNSNDKIKFMQAALDIDSENINAVKQLAGIYQSGKQYEKAKEYIDRARELELARLRNSDYEVSALGYADSAKYWNVVKGYSVQSAQNGMMFGDYKNSVSEYEYLMSTSPDDNNLKKNVLGSYQSALFSDDRDKLIKIIGDSDDISIGTKKLGKFIDSIEVDKKFTEKQKTDFKAQLFSRDEVSKLQDELKSIAKDKEFKQLSNADKIKYLSVQEKILNSQADSLKQFGDNAEKEYRKSANQARLNKVQVQNIVKAKTAYDDVKTLSKKYETATGEEKEKLGKTIIAKLDVMKKGGYQVSNLEKAKYVTETEAKGYYEKEVLRVDRIKKPTSVDLFSKISAQGNLNDIAGIRTTLKSLDGIKLTTEQNKAKTDIEAQLAKMSVPKKNPIFNPVTTQDYVNALSIVDSIQRGDDLNKYNSLLDMTLDVSNKDDVFSKQYLSSVITLDNIKKSMDSKSSALVLQDPLFKYTKAMVEFRLGNVGVANDLLSETRNMLSSNSNFDKEYPRLNSNVESMKGYIENVIKKDTIKNNIEYGYYDSTLSRGLDDSYIMTSLSIEGANGYSELPYEEQKKYRDIAKTNLDKAKSNFELRQKELDSKSMWDTTDALKNERDESKRKYDIALAQYNIHNPPNLKEKQTEVQELNKQLEDLSKTTSWSGKWGGEYKEKIQDVKDSIKQTEYEIDFAKNQFNEESLNKKIAVTRNAMLEAKYKFDNYEAKYVSNFASSTDGYGNKDDRLKLESDFNKLSKEYESLTKGYDYRGLDYALKESNVAELYSNYKIHGLSKMDNEMSLTQSLDVALRGYKMGDDGSANALLISLGAKLDNLESSGEKIDVYEFNDMKNKINLFKGKLAGSDGFENEDRINMLDSIDDELVKIAIIKNEEIKPQIEHLEETRVYHKKIIEDLKSISGEVGYENVNGAKVQYNTVTRQYEHEQYLKNTEFELNDLRKSQFKAAVSTVAYDKSVIPVIEEYAKNANSKLEEAKNSVPNSIKFLGSITPILAKVANAPLWFLDVADVNVEYFDGDIVSSYTSNQQKVLADATKGYIDSSKQIFFEDLSRKHENEDPSTLQEAAYNYAIAKTINTQGLEMVKPLIEQHIGDGAFESTEYKISDVNSPLLRESAMALSIAQAKGRRFIEDAQINKYLGEKSSWSNFGFTGAATYLQGAIGTANSLIEEVTGYDFGVGLESTVENYYAGSKKITDNMYAVESVFDLTKKGVSLSDIEKIKDQKGLSELLKKNGLSSMEEYYSNLLPTYLDHKSDYGVSVDGSVKTDSGADIGYFGGEARTFSQKLTNTVDSFVSPAGLVSTYIGSRVMGAVGGAVGSTAEKVLHPKLFDVASRAVNFVTTPFKVANAAGDNIAAMVSSKFGVSTYGKIIGGFAGSVLNQATGEWLAEEGGIGYVFDMMGKSLQFISPDVGHYVSDSLADVIEMGAGRGSVTSIMQSTNMMMNSELGYKPAYYYESEGDLDNFAEDIFNRENINIEDEIKNKNLEVDKNHKDTLVFKWKGDKSHLSPIVVATPKSSFSNGIKLDVKPILTSNDNTVVRVVADSDWDTFVANNNQLNHDGSTLNINKDYLTWTDNLKQNHVVMKKSVENILDNVEVAKKDSLRSAFPSLASSLGFASETVKLVRYNSDDMAKIPVDNAPVNMVKDSIVESKIVDKGIVYTSDGNVATQVLIDSVGDFDKIAYGMEQSNNWKTVVNDNKNGVIIAKTESGKTTLVSYKDVGLIKPGTKLNLGKDESVEVMAVNPSSVVGRTLLVSKTDTENKAIIHEQVNVDLKTYKNAIQNSKINIVSDNIDSRDGSGHFVYNDGNGVLVVVSEKTEDTFYHNGVLYKTIAQQLQDEEFVKDEYKKILDPLIEQKVMQGISRTTASDQIANEISKTIENTRGISVDDAINEYVVSKISETKDYSHLVDNGVLTEDEFNSVRNDISEIQNLIENKIKEVRGEVLSTSHQQEDISNKYIAGKIISNQKVDTASDIVFGIDNINQPLVAQIHNIISQRTGVQDADDELSHIIIQRASSQNENTNDISTYEVNYKKAKAMVENARTTLGVKSQFDNNNNDNNGIEIEYSTELDYVSTSPTVSSDASVKIHIDESDSNTPISLLKYISNEATESDLAIAALSRGGNTYGYHKLDSNGEPTGEIGVDVDKVSDVFSNEVREIEKQIKQEQPDISESELAKQTESKVKEFVYNHELIHLVSNDENTFKVREELTLKQRNQRSEDVSDALSRVSLGISLESDEAALSNVKPEFIQAAVLNSKAPSEVALYKYILNDANDNQKYKLRSVSIEKITIEDSTRTSTEDLEAILSQKDKPKIKSEPIKYWSTLAQNSDVVDRIVSKIKNLEELVHHESMTEDLLSEVSSDYTFVRNKMKYHNDLNNIVKGKISNVPKATLYHKAGKTYKIVFEDGNGNTQISTVDIHDFKNQINGRYGHGIGDTYLSETANKLDEFVGNWDDKVSPEKYLEDILKDDNFKKSIIDSVESKNKHFAEIVLNSKGDTPESLSGVIDNAFGELSGDSAKLQIVSAKRTGDVIEVKYGDIGNAKVNAKTGDVISTNMDSSLLEFETKKQIDGSVDVVIKARRMLDVSELGFYAGVSKSMEIKSTKDAQTLNDQSTKAGKTAQLSDIGAMDFSIVTEDGMSVAKIAKGTAIRKFTDNVESLFCCNMKSEQILKNEYDGFGEKINPEVDIDKMFQERQDALDSKDLLEIEKANHNILAISLQNIEFNNHLDGNNLFKLAANKLLDAKGDIKFSQVFIVGGDEIGFLISGNGKVRFARVDINNFGATGRNKGNDYADLLKSEILDIVQKNILKELSDETSDAELSKQINLDVLKFIESTKEQFDLNLHPSLSIGVVEVNERFNEVDATYLNHIADSASESSKKASKARISFDKTTKDVVNEGGFFEAAKMVYKKGVTSRSDVSDLQWEWMQEYNAEQVGEFDKKNGVDWKTKLTKRSDISQDDIDTVRRSLGNTPKSMSNIREKHISDVIFSFEDSLDIAKLQKRMTVLQDAAMLNALELAKNKLSNQGFKTDSDFAAFISGSQSRFETGIDSDFEVTIVYDRKESKLKDLFRGIVGRNSDDIYFENLGIEIRRILSESGFNVEENGVIGAERYDKYYSELGVSIISRDDYRKQINSLELFQISEALDFRTVFTSSKLFDISVKSIVKEGVKPISKKSSNAFLSKFFKNTNEVTDAVKLNEEYLDSLVDLFKINKRNDLDKINKRNQRLSGASSNLKAVLEKQYAEIDKKELSSKVKPASPDEFVDILGSDKVRFLSGDLKRGPFGIRYVQQLIASGQAYHLLQGGSLNSHLKQLVNAGWMKSDQALDVSKYYDFISILRTNLEVISKGQEGEKFYLTDRNVDLLFNKIKGKIKYDIDGEVKTIETIDDFKEAYVNHMKKFSDVYIDIMNRNQVANGVFISDPVIRNNVRNEINKVKEAMC